MNSTLCSKLELAHKTLLKFYRPAQKKLEKIREALSRPEKKPLKLLLAVSGGADSIALLNICYDLKDSQNLELAVAHFDHALRKESADEARFVEKSAIDLSLPFYSSRATDSPEKTNLEAWARSRRYEFLTTALNSWGGDLILTAHHQNDQAETLLFRILTGRLMRDSHCISFFDASRRLARILLDYKKSELEVYLKDKNICSVFDSSNDDLSRTRNRIRNSLIPILEKDFNPNLVSSLSQISSRLSHDEDYLWKSAMDEYLRLKEDLRVWNLYELEESILWRLLILKAKDDLGEDAGKLSYINLQLAIELIREGKAVGASLDLGSQISLEFKKSGKLLFFQTQKLCKNL